jgi:hypothetical protein|tara:strand:+ start:188 stop:331 length:144 start_codon:yes stop_codon:yes gene_type:complete
MSKKEKELELRVEELEKNLIELTLKLPVIIQNVIIRNKPINKNKNHE